MIRRHRPAFHTLCWLRLLPTAATLPDTSARMNPQRTTANSSGSRCRSKWPSRHSSSARARSDGWTWCTVHSVRMQNVRQHHGRRSIGERRRGRGGRSSIAVAVGRFASRFRSRFARRLARWRARGGFSESDVLVKGESRPHDENLKDSAEIEPAMDPLAGSIASLERKAFDELRSSP